MNNSPTLLIIDKGYILKRTYQPSNTKRKRTFGFLTRMSHKAGRKVLNRRRQKEESGWPSSFSRLIFSPFLAAALIILLRLMKTYGLGKEEKLLKAVEFKRALRKGSGSSTEHFTVLICPNDLQQRRLGITASRKTGSAAKRNRIKRLLREFFQAEQSAASPLL